MNVMPTYIISYVLVFLLFVLILHQIMFLYKGIKRGYFIFRHVRIEKVDNEKLFEKIIYVRVAMITILLVAVVVNIMQFFR